MATAPVRTILLVAAEKRELAGVLSHCSNPTACQTSRDRKGAVAHPAPDATSRDRKGAVVHPAPRFARVGELNGQHLVVVANGPGPELAGQAADWAREEFGADVLVSVGFCGALDPALKVCEMFLASAVDAERASFAAAIPRTVGAFACGRLMSVDRVARSVEEKQRLRATGASAIEMEAGAIALRAEKWSVPFYCVRVVTDRADEGFAVDFNAVRDANGRFSRMRILRRAMEHPWRCFPELFQIERRTRRAALVLGDFIASCEF